MTARFDAFVLFADMRTGSNFLEANLNALDGVACLGEAFNASFIGYPNADAMLTMTQAERDADPHALLARIRAGGATLQGFRYFSDHDPRVLDAILDDARIAKIVLTRNPVDSYVSRKIAQQTGQWKLTNVTRRKDARVVFDAAEFETQLAAQQAFRAQVMRRLKVSGQTAFAIAYEDLSDVAVLNGLAAWLGVDARLGALDKTLKRQNPDPLREKVANPDAMARALSARDPFGLDHEPWFEPERGPVVPSYVAGARTPLLYMPVRSGPETTVRRWLAALDGVADDALPGDFRQAGLLQWKRDRPGHRSFTVVRHPLARAHDAFCTRILSTGPGAFLSIRKTLRRAHDLPIPEDAPDDSWDATAHREAFTAFLGFVKANLSGQTAVRVDPHWASQTRCIEGMAGFSLPDVILREADLPDALPALARQVGHAAPPTPVPDPTRAPVSLAEIYDSRIEELSREAYARDYAMFGFSDWDGAPG